MTMKKEVRQKIERQNENVWRSFAKMFGWKDNTASFNDLMEKIIEKYPAVANDEGRKKVDDG